MNTKRFKELKQACDDENLSYGEIVEIEQMAKESGVKVTDDMMIVDIVIELEGLVK